MAIRVLIGMPFAAALGGSERLLRTLAVGSADAGLELHVAFFAPGPLERELAGLGIATSVCPLGRFRDVHSGARAVRALARIVRRDRPALALAWLPRAHVYLAPAARLADRSVRVAWWQHHHGLGEQALWRLATKLPADGIVCTSAAVAALQAGVWPHRPLHVCHPGVGEPSRPSAGALDDLRARLGIAPGTTVLTLPGRLVAWKGHDRFLEALALLRGGGRAVTGLILGGNPEDPGAEPRLVARARALDVPCVVTGHVDDPAAYLALSDVVVNASEPEPFGMTLPEAMALGVPVLAVDAGGPQEIIQPEVSGLLVPDGSPRALADGLARLVDAPDLRARLATAGRARYEERFSAEAFVQRAGGVVRQLVGCDTPRRYA